MPLGRPLALDNVKRGEVVALLNAGLTRREAARYVGCAVRTIVREERRCEQFRRAVRDAELTARFDPETLMRRAAVSNWRAAAWLLERTNPRKFARRPPDACRPADVERACERVIEAGLAAVDDPRARRRAFVRMNAAAEDATRTLAAPPEPVPRRRDASRAPFTPLVDSERLELQIDEIAAAWAAAHPRSPALDATDDPSDSPLLPAPERATADIAPQAALAAPSNGDSPASDNRPPSADAPSAPPARSAPRVDKSRPAAAAPDRRKSNAHYALRTAVSYTPLATFVRANPHADLEAPPGDAAPRRPPLTPPPDPHNAD
jgi:hypothetical protein